MWARLSLHYENVKWTKKAEQDKTEWKCYESKFQNVISKWYK